jgi:3-deoxy-D-manno-octulosonic-acid transferase
MRYFYNLLLYLILPFLPLRLLWKSRKNSAYLQRMGERFGYYNFPAIKSAIWVHAVSVGEAISAIPLIKELIRLYPANKIIVTTMTPTGAERVRNAFNENDAVQQVYVPYDYPHIVQRFLTHIDPKILIIIETELWPNILYYAKRNAIPIILANARLSATSFAQYKRVNKFIREMLNCINHIAAQSMLDATRFRDLGVAEQCLQVAGNVKFDIQITDAIQEAGKALRLKLQDRLIWVAGSTHKGEELKILAAATEINTVIPNVLLILVPRHPERFTEVFDLCKSRGFNTVRYTALQDYTATTNVMVGDVMGKLLQFYAAGDVAFVGGSLIAFGGHNLLEPAVLQKPVLSGPNLSAFAEVSELLIAHNALLKVNDEFELAAQVITLLQDERLRGIYGANAYQVVLKNRGGTANILNVIQQFLR